MDIRSLRYFIETVKHQSFTQAAQSLNVTQSTISKMVKQLEDELGENVWLTADADPELIFDVDYDGKWAKALAGLGVDPAQLSGQSGRA